MGKQMTMRTSHTVALAGSVVLALHAAGIQAQERPSTPSPAEPGPLQEIVVTGSLLQNSQYEQKSPVQVLSREDFESSAPDTISDIAKNLTVSGGAEFQNE